MANKSSSKHWIQKAVNPAHKGRCKSMGSPECPKGSPQYNLAKNLKKIARNNKN